MYLKVIYILYTNNPLAPYRNLLNRYINHLIMYLIFQKHSSFGIKVSLKALKDRILNFISLLMIHYIESNKKVTISYIYTILTPSYALTYTYIYIQTQCIISDNNIMLMLPYRYIICF